jgi:RNA polymerase sigma factor (sigma-70 family)
MAAYLSKDQELELGVLIQKAVKAKALREAAAEAESFELDGVAVPAQELTTIIESGNSAVEKLLEHNTALVWSRARNFKSKHPASADLDDLVQEGYVGLLRAAEKYDPSRGNKFSTVAFYWIDQAIARSVSKTGRLIRLPENREQDFYGIMKIRSLYEDSELSANEIDEIAMDELNLSKSDFNNILQAAAIPTSLSRRVGSGDSDSKELIDYIADRDVEDSSEALAMREGLRNLLFEKLGTLSQLEKDIVTASFLIEDTANKRLSMKELRDIHNLTPQKFKKVLNSALAKLKTELEGLDITFADFLD